jgi:hypothetical protein
MSMERQTKTVNGVGTLTTEHAPVEAYLASSEAASKTNPIVPIDLSAGTKIIHWFQRYAGPAAKEILAFCERHDLVKELKDAVNLAEKCFQPSIIRLEEDIDPETDDKQIVISLSVCNKSRQAVLGDYRDFTRQSVKILPWPKSSFIRLSYDIL